MPQNAVTEEEIEAIEEPSGNGQYSIALALAQDMLGRARDDETIMRILFSVLTCSTRLKLDEITNDAIRRLEQLPDPRATRIFADFIQALADLSFNKPQEALNLIEANLDSGLLDSDDCNDHKYEHLVYKGRSLGRLGRYVEALDALDAGHRMCPQGKYETDILIARSNCLMALDRYDESFDAARQTLNRGDEEMATLGMQYMAECRMWQGRVQESLEIYSAIQKRLPCRFIEEERIQEGIRNGVAYLERLRPQRMPS